MSYDVGDRMRGLRYLAGYREMGQLAKRLTELGNGRGLKTKTLRNIEQGQRSADYRELREIAEACDMPVEWFTADFSRLPQISEDARTVVAEKKREWAALQEPGEVHLPPLAEDLQPGETDVSPDQPGRERSETDGKQAA